MQIGKSPIIINFWDRIVKFLTFLIILIKRIISDIYIYIYIDSYILKLSIFLHICLIISVSIRHYYNIIIT